MEGIHHGVRDGVSEVNGRWHDAGSGCDYLAVRFGRMRASFVIMVFIRFSALSELL